MCYNKNKKLNKNKNIIKYKKNELDINRKFRRNKK